MNSGTALLVLGVSLLSVSSLLGFLQHRHRAHAEPFALWRVVHVGGTAGAVQLIALSAVWPRFAASGAWGAALAAGLIAATWAFFLGPLARALGRPRLASVINGVGAAFALPSYLALPLLLLG